MELSLIESLKIYFTRKFTIAGFGLLLTSLIYLSNADYYDFKDRKCIVLDKLEQGGGYKRSGVFYLVLKEESGVVFDLSVRPSTYSQAEIGKTLTLKIKESYIKLHLF